ncbi:MAG: hypothetical protein ABW220_15850 [Burkholderiaceae bacterium]
MGGVIGGVLYVHGLPFGIRERQQVQFDPARVIVVRTPGGFLEVSTLVKAEEFRWRSSYTCPWGDCGGLLGQRIGQVRVPVHYTFRIPLAESWTLRPEGDAYVLSVPAPVPRLPPGIDMGKAEFSSERGGLLVPGRAANQESLLRNLGPELERRAQRPEYLQQQMPAADKTVQEFAQKWMKEQAAAPVRPVRVEFRMNDSN